MNNKPQIIIRMGSHAEKGYILKLSNRAFDGIIIGANVVEATAGATASLVGKKLNLPYYIDPMTYVFGCNLSGIRSEQRQTVNGRKKTVVDYKRSYKALAGELGTFFTNVLDSGIPVAPNNFPFSSIQTICEQVVHYQLNRIRAEFEKDEEYKDYADSIPSPASIFAPYFYVPFDFGGSLDLFLRLSETTARTKPGVPVHAVLCADCNLLNNASFISDVVEKTPKTGIDGVWLWFSMFDEWEAQEGSLRNFKELVRQLSESGLEVYNRHGGCFSLILHELGMSGISHGIGYGERKDVLQITGPPNAPIVNYYLPDVYKRFGVDVIERSFDSLGVTTPKDFHESICDCAICKGVIKNDLSDFGRFGDTHYATPKSKRRSQTPAAAKRCRFHFLMNRIAEKDFVSRNNIASIVEKLRQAQNKWQPSNLFISFDHVGRWINALVPES